MAAFARGKIVLQNSFSVMGNSRSSFSSPYHVQRSRLFSNQSKPLSTSTNLGNCSTSRSPSRTTLILPVSVTLKNSQDYSTETNASKKVYFPEEVDPQKFKLSEIRKNTKGGNFISIYYELDGMRLRVQTPVMRVPFDVLKKTDNTNGYPNINFALAIEGRDSDPAVKKFVGLLSAVDELTRNAAIKHGASLFQGKVPTKELLDFQFKGSLKASKEPLKYPPVVKFRFNNNKEGAPTVIVTDASTKETMPLTSIMRNSRVMCLVEPSMMWFVGGQFGVSWTVISVRVIQQGEQAAPDFRDPEEVEFR